MPGSYEMDFGENIRRDFRAFFGSERAKKAIRVYLFVLGVGDTVRLPAGGVFFWRQQHSQHTTNAPASLLIGDTLARGI